MNDPREQRFWGCRPEIWAGLLILGTTALRVWFVQSGQLDLVQDEAQYWDWSRTPQLSYFTKGPLIAYIISAGSWLFGDTALGVRAGAIAGSFASQCILYVGIAGLWNRPRLGLLTLVVLNTTIFFMASGILMTTDSPLMVCWWAALFALYEAGRRPERLWPFVVMGVALALGTWGKYMMLAFSGTAILYGLLLLRRMQAGSLFWKRLFVTLLAGSFVGLMPILLWNVGNDFAGFKHVAHLGGMAGKGSGQWLRFDRFPEYFGSQFGLLMPWWFCFCVYGAWGVLTRLFGSHARAAKATEALEYRQVALLAVGFWPVWGFFAVWCFHTKVHPNWSAVSYASGMILAAVIWDRIWRELSGRTWKVWLWPVIGAAFFAVFLVHDRLPIPWRLEGKVPFTETSFALENPALHLKGWSDLGREIDELRRTRFDDPDNVFLFGDHYDVTSALSFFVPGQQRAFCATTGRRLNQYDLWPGPDYPVGAGAIFVRKGFDKGTLPEVPLLFDKIEGMNYQSTHGGRPARRFTIFLCYGYKGEWPPMVSTEY
ncbi:glycosyltransferase family 39 protein [Desulfovibrio ferrophilus]|uniref:Dolichyl-phosphate-mannose-protein mannosyltransferase family protein n=1 Tax=Desulfovibrio ferrophilus TaxID=241368 RepID=A0A2Z6AV29_9BACT|nr:glycosyltransferase family 39 protein [Desulfovibrio ferrophilus]BBD07070.1 dolichyl-phosphate-mannose-protein mannosyltransferase family protein [Desulfovibrio ferrophilus]